MAAYNKFNQFVKDILDGKHNFLSDTFKVMLTDTAPVATNSVKGDLTEIASGNGYPAGGLVASLTEALTGGVIKISATDLVFTAAGGNIGPVRYAVLYNATSATQPLIAWWDYGSSFTLAPTETLTVDFDAVNGIFQLS